MKHTRKSLVCLLLVLLLAAAALTGCARYDVPVTTVQSQTEAPKTNAPETEAPKTNAPETEAPATTDAPETEAPATTDAPETEAPATTNAPETTTAATPAEGEKQELGEGDKLFYFDVTFSNGETSSYAIHTDADTVGAALVDLNLIAGEDSQYGLYVKTIGEETLDYDTNGMYWAFYENGEYAMTGVDSTAITDGMTYAFVATKG